MSTLTDAPLVPLHYFDHETMIAACGNDEGPFTFYFREVTCPRCRVLLAEPTPPAAPPAARPEESDHEQSKEKMMIPTVGRTVLYTLTENDAAQINRRRTSGSDIAARMKTSVESKGQNPLIFGWPEGAQAHIGNAVAAGDVFPMVICRTWGDTPESAVNGQVLLDGNDTFWATSVRVGSEQGNWAWPTIQK